MTCTRCRVTGFVNSEQVPGEVVAGGVEAVLAWMAAQTEPNDVTICDCCGDGETWYGEPGEHYRGGDERGPCGPYAYNGGLPECS